MKEKRQEANGKNKGFYERKVEFFHLFSFPFLKEQRRNKEKRIDRWFSSLFFSFFEPLTEGLLTAKILFEKYSGEQKVKRRGMHGKRYLAGCQKLFTGQLFPYKSGLFSAEIDMFPCCSLRRCLKEGNTFENYESPLPLIKNHYFLETLTMAKDERRSPGSGSLYKEDRNGKPAWTAIHKRTVNGKLVRISKKGFAKKSEAEKWLYEHKDEFERKCAIEAGDVSAAELTAEKITFGQLIDEYLKSRNYKTKAPKVQKQYLTYITYFRMNEEFCKLKVRHVDTKKCQEIVDAYGDTFNMRKKAKTVLSAILTYAIKADLLHKNNPAHAVELPENLPGEKEIFTTTEELVITAYYIKAINPVPEKTRNGKYTSREDFMLAAAYTLILIHTGARPGEIYNVKPENVDFQKRIIKHAGIKTLRSKEGNIFFSQYIEPLVRKYLTPVNQFQRYSQGGLYDLCKRFYELINIKPHVPSAGRTTMATRLALNDTNIETMTDILRHSDSRTTYRHYVKVKGEKALQTVEEMDKGFSEYTSEDNENAVVLNEFRRQTEGWSDEEVIAALCELLEVDRQEKEEKTSIFEFEPKNDDLEF